MKLSQTICRTGVSLALRLSDRLADRQDRQSSALVLLLFLAAAPALSQELPFGDPGNEPAAQVADDIALSQRDFPDEQIAERLTGLFASIDGLQGVEITVKNGVVNLEGQVMSPESRELATVLASRVDGVVTVESSIQLEKGLSSRLNNAVERLGNGWNTFIASAPVLLVALLMVGLAWAIANFVASRDRLLAKLAPNPFVRSLLQQLLKAAIIIAGITSALSLMNATALLGSMAGALGLIGLAVGFATRDTVENFIASILLSVRQPFDPRDHVVIGDEEGIVMRLSSRATVLMSLDGNHIRIPNAAVYKSTITNFTRNPRRRFQFTVGVDTDLDLAEPRELAQQVLSSIPGVLSEPQPLCLVDKLGESSVILRILAWVDQETADFGKVRSRAQQLVKDAFDEAGIVMPEPIYNVNLRRSSQTRRASAGQQKQPRASAEEPESTKPDQALDRQMDELDATEPAENFLRADAPGE